MGSRCGVTGSTVTIDLKLRYVYEDVDRHGNVRIYFMRRKGARKVRIHEASGTEAFAKQYHELLRRSETGEFEIADDHTASKANTWRWLVGQYVASAEFKRLDPQTQRTRRGILEATCREPIAPGANELFANFPLTRLTTKALKVLRDRKAGLPESANNRVKAIRQVFRWALEEEHVKANPARDLVKVKSASQGFHSWTVDEVERFEKRHPIGTKARLALALFTYTGVRRSDLVRLGKQHRRIVTNRETGVSEPWLKFTQQKNRNRKPVLIEIPVLPELDRIIDASPTGDLTYLVTEYGQPFTANGFGSKMRQWCDQAELPDCSSHGLRKASAAIAAENGATAHQLMAIFGWLALAEAERYTAAARRRRMAADAMGMLVRNEK